MGITTGLGYYSGFEEHQVWDPHTLPTFCCCLFPLLRALESGSHLLLLGFAPGSLLGEEAEARDIGGEGKGK